MQTVTRGAPGDEPPRTIAGQAGGRRGADELEHRTDHACVARWEVGVRDTTTLVSCRRDARGPSDGARRERSSAPQRIQRVPFGAALSACPSCFFLLSPTTPPCPFFFLNDPAPPEFSPFPLHAALPI